MKPGPADARDMTEERVWLVEREVDSRDLLTLTYATPDGSRAYTRTLSAHVVDEVTAAKDVETAELETVDDGVVDRYAEEATRMQERHDPEDVV